MNSPSNLSTPGGAKDTAGTSTASLHAGTGGPELASSGPLSPGNKRFSDADWRTFLDALDAAAFEVTDREAHFIESTMGTLQFSANQRGVCDGLLDKYGERIGF